MTPSTSRSPARPSADLPWWKSALFSLVAVVLVLGLVELALGLAGVTPISDEEDPYVGFSSMAPLFVERTGPDGNVFLATAPNKRLAFNAQRFPKEKADGTYRIFCLGGSTTYGRPYENPTSFPGWLGELLPAADSTRHWEVINAGGISYASYRVAELMKELVRWQGDLFIIYTGHNEFLERRTYGRLLATPGFVRQLGTLASRTRTYAALSRLLGRSSRPPTGATAADATPAGKEVLPAEVEAVLDKSVGPSAYHRDDEWHTHVLEHYRSSLLRMIATARRAGARVILVTPASNLADCTPFRSEHGTGLSEEQAGRVDRLCAEAAAAQEAGRPEEAVAKLDEALAADERYAQAHFLRGRALEALGRGSEARAAFLRARDEDVCPLRALSRTIDIVKKVAHETNTPLVDFVGIVEERSPDGIPGASLFLDHVHPTIEGNRMIALAVLDAMTREGIVRPSATFDDAAVNAVTARVEGAIDRRAHGVALMNLAKVLGWAGKYEESDRLALEALEVVPDEPGVHFQLALGCARRNDVAGAVRHYERTLEGNPRHVQAYLNLGVLFRNQFEPGKAAYWFREGVKAVPENAELRYSLGVVLADQRNYAEAKRELEEAIRLDPRNDDARSLLRDVTARLPPGS